MGLNICRSIVEFHQGRLTLEDNPGGRNRLPLHASACDRHETLEENARQSGNR